MRHVHVRYRRVLPHDQPTCFEWLTDYDEADPERAGGVVLQHRPVVERTEDKVVLDATVEVLGRRGSGRTEVRLFPPDRYEAHILEGGGRGSVYVYRLTPKGDGTLLEVDYGIAVKSWKGWARVNVARPLILRELDRMWANYADAMAREVTN